MANVESHNREATRHSQSREEGMELEDVDQEVEALEMSDCSSDEDWAAAAVTALLIPMSAGEIVKLLPKLSPGLREALLLDCRERFMDAGSFHLDLGEMKELFELTSFGAEVEAQVGGAVGSDVILQQLSLCLLLVTAASLPDTRDINILLSFDDKGRYFGGMYYGEQAVEALCSALVAQHLHLAPDEGVRRLYINYSGSSGTHTGGAHLAHLLKSRHCRLQELEMSATGAGGIHHIARALRTNTSLTQLVIDTCPEVGDGGVEQLAAMLRTNYIPPSRTSP